MSLDALASRSEIGRSDVEAIIAGQMEADADAIHSLAGALGVSPGNFFEGVEWIPGDEAEGDYRIEG